MTERNRDHQVHAYERMLDHLRSTMEQAGLGLREALETAKQRAVELGELTREEAEHAANFLRRDIEDAAHYSATTTDDLKGWLRMDLRLVESWIWDRFSSVADKTRLELMELQRELQQSPEYSYYAGEITGPGTLTCSHCGEVVCFNRAEQIAPCPKCQGTVYRRTPTHEAEARQGQ